MTKILLALFITSLINNIFCEESNTRTETQSDKIEEEELVESETKDGKLEIIKRIKKVNPDGSYTIGYEADDGSFKIESRDVLGNIKGTYGFLDDGGEIKRVSYSSSNATDVFTKHEPVSTPEFPNHQNVVQRIAKNEKFVSTTNKSLTPSSTTLSTPTTTPLSVIQSIARRRASSTTIKPSYSTIETIRTTAKPNTVTYASASPRVLLQRPSIALTKSEGQINRPDVHEKPTEIPVFRIKNLVEDKPVTEERNEIRSNILRRQLPKEGREQSTFNAEEHIYSLQQSLGHNDVSDIYNSGATSRPLFTTTRSNRVSPFIQSTTAAPIAVPKPTTKYVAHYQRNQLQEVESNTATYTQPLQEATSTEPASISTNVPVVQIPANRPVTPEPLVAVRHPFQPGAILVPLSQLQNRILPVDNMQDVYNARRQYAFQQQPPQLTTRAPLVEVERQNVKTINQPPLRPIPVHVDGNGFIREMSAHAPTPYSISYRVAPEPVRQPVNNEVDNEIENIEPPVSTKDFQILLNHLIIRQKRLERISALTNPKLHPEFYQQQQPVRYQRLVPATQPYFVQRVLPQNYEQQNQEPRGSTRQYVAVRPQEVEASNSKYRYQYRQIDEENEDPKRVATTYERQPVYLTNRRRSRLVPSRPTRQNQLVDPVYQQDEPQSEEYLPPDVREMLLLRMLQLAMNPSLPLDEEDESQPAATASTPQYKKAPVRNVEILGEEDGDDRNRRPVARSKRYKDKDEVMDYME
ncbi:unnamed protein product [Ceutorhynchus assimilis]|uniref:Uncharacterized protein n=1 Tax=Ceutorhynchus assimilis TaxID=467358 RepID=A0A9N9MUG9_9CUCU|nr:unnamed protein product [Ceutorhynchus assimilis]